MFHRTLTNRNKRRQKFNASLQSDQINLKFKGVPVQISPRQYQIIQDKKKEKSPFRYHRSSSRKNRPRYSQYSFSDDEVNIVGDESSATQHRLNNDLGSQIQFIVPVQPIAALAPTTKKKKRARSKPKVVKKDFLALNKQQVIQNRNQ